MMKDNLSDILKREKKIYKQAKGLLLKENPKDLAEILYRMACRGKTYFLNKRLQCGNRNRSVVDTVLLTKTYFPNISESSVLEAVASLNESKLIYIGYCVTMRKHFLVLLSIGINEEKFRETLNLLKLNVRYSRKRSGKN